MSIEEAWEVVFEDPTTVPLIAPEQLHFPPFRRYWTIGRTQGGRQLLVVWEKHREIRNLITAFEPSEEKIKIYEQKTKKNK
ncbi:MAG: hypothetical protein AAB309_02975 [Deltaproteobacteria bacterium]